MFSVALSRNKRRGVGGFQTKWDEGTEPVLKDYMSCLQNNYKKTEQMKCQCIHSTDAQETLSNSLSPVGKFFFFFLFFFIFCC